MLLSQLAIGAILLCITVVIHAVVLDRLLNVFEKGSNRVRLMFGKSWKIPVLVIAVLGVFTAHVVQIWLWAMFYLYIEVLPDLESALYFSTTTFTTVGYGDVFLDKDWRLLSSVQSANGFIMFGWSTAFIFEIMSKLYKGENNAQG